ncbi:sulfatase [Kineosporia sp. NBRC 101731]|uniref:sulfatase family protein n=1 Tax=Kineosporia sp. NBRC 101731 TaxID=3032199 RepID=UPI0024A2C54A|nr:sulfatase [Kineosporia sp. NBRC 101731]GLY28165.1 hypothetical protein Kisp02_15300 [Kineosporia sp. NBRC 101731]
MLKTRAAALISAVLMTTLAACNGSAPASPAASSAPATSAQASKPNIVFVLTDDLSMNLVPYMSEVGKMQTEGVTFDQYIVANSLCCPSRANIFTGRYPHNTGIKTNTANTGGGYQVFKSLGLDQDTFATDLQDAGYRTAMMGKYMNEYQPGSPKKPTTDNPAGWDEWALAASGYAGFNYNLNINGQVRHYGRNDTDYLTDVLTGLGQDFIQRSADEGEPFLLELSTFTPHKPYIPAPRHADTYPGLKAPRTAGSYDEKNTDAPRWLASQELTPSRKAKMDQQFRQRVQAVQSINDMIRTVRAQLEKSGVADNTYIVFSADNGYHMGEHSLISGKMTAFDTDVNVPMIVVGPDVPAGSTVSAPASTVDLRSTFGEIAGATVPTTVDGQSLVPLWEGGATDRLYSLIEHTGMELDTMDPDNGIFRSPIPPNYTALRSRKWLYVEYDNGDREYYDLTDDPLQMHNVYRDVSKKSRAELHRKVIRAKRCSGQTSCATALTPTP